MADRLPEGLHLRRVQRGERLGETEWAALLARLPAAEVERISARQRWQDRQDSALGWRLLLDLADEHGVRVGRRPDGRPVADPPADVSLAHAAGWVTAVFRQDGRVGVDVEAERPISAELARRCLTPDELAWWAAEPAYAEARFAELWTAKEAYLKAVGTGLATDPRTVNPDPDRWCVLRQQPAPGIHLSVCLER